MKKLLVLHIDFYGILIKIASTFYGLDISWDAYLITFIVNAYPDLPLFFDASLLEKIVPPLLFWFRCDIRAMVRRLLLWSN